MFVSSIQSVPNNNHGRMLTNHVILLKLEESIISNYELCMFKIMIKV